MSGVLRTASTRRFLQDYEVPTDQLVWLANWKANGLPYCSIYVISPEGNWPSKIGIAVCARNRVNGMQTTHWKRLVVTHCFWATTVAEARKVEKKAHALLKEENAYLLGEWFDKKPDKAAEVVQFAAMCLGIELHDKITDGRVLREIESYARARRQEQATITWGTKGYYDEDEPEEPLYNSWTGRRIS